MESDLFVSESYVTLLTPGAQPPAHHVEPALLPGRAPTSPTPATRTTQRSRLGIVVCCTYTDSASCFYKFACCFYGIFPRMNNVIDYLSDGIYGGEDTDMEPRHRRSIVDIPSSESEVGGHGGDVEDDSSVLDSSSDSNLEHNVPSVGPSGEYTADPTPMELDGSHTTASVSNMHINVGQVAAVGVHTNEDSVETPSLRCSVHTKSWAARMHSL